MKQDADRLELEALRLANRAARSIAQLESHRKSLVKEHAERIKRLRQIIESIQQREQMGTLGLEDAVQLSESAAALVHNPLEGLDVVTYTLNRQPVQRLRYDGASEAAKVSCEMFERLLELDTLKHDSAANLVRRLATLADLSPSAFRLVLRAGSGDTGSILASFEDQARDRGKTRQALHWEWQEDVRRIRMVFPEVAAVLVELRETIKHREDAMSSADGLREAMRQQEGE